MAIDFGGQTALITGASTGIGAVYANAFAARGAHLVLVARSRDKLDGLATKIRTAHGVRVDVLAADLSTPDGCATVTALEQDIDILINNAGFGMHGDVADADAARLADQVRLNCLAVVQLTARFLPGMIARRRGTVVNIASTAAFQPLPYMAVYGATKAFVLSFTEALWAEARPAGVRVLAMCHGATETPFFEIVGTDDAAVGSRRAPEQVVATTFRALERGRPSVVDGRRNALLAGLVGLLPRRLVISAAERTIRPKPAQVR